MLVKARKAAAPGRPPYKTFAEYIALSMTDPELLRSPYRREDERVLAYMSWLKRRWLRESQGLRRPHVSIVLAGSPRHQRIRRAILSVLYQSVSEFELLIVDDGATNEMRTAVQAFDDPRIRHVEVTHHEGTAAAHNVALDQARGRYIAYLDPDGWWDPGFLQVLLHRAIETGHEFLYSAQRILRAAAGPSRDESRPEVVRFAAFNAGLLENNNYISRSTALHSRDLALTIGGYDEDLAQHWDVEFFLRAAASFPPLGVPVVLSHHDQAMASSASTASGEETRDEALSRCRTTLEHRHLSEIEDLPTQGPSDGLDRPNAPRLYGLVPSLRRRPLAESRRPTTIVIPSFGVPEALSLCIASLRAYTRNDAYSLVVVDNGSGDQVKAVLDRVELDEATTVIRNPRNLGFTHAVAQGMDASGPDSDIVVMNNDSVVTPGWLPALHDVGHLHQEAGIVAPRQTLLPGNKHISTHVPGATVEYECDTNLSAHHRNVVDPYYDTRHAITELRFAPFFCVLIRREAIDVCGPPDTRMGAHYQSDWVYCEAVRRYAGMRILHTPFSKVYHHQGLSTQELRTGSPDEFMQMAVANDWRGVELRARAGTPDSEYRRG